MANHAANPVSCLLQLPAVHEHFLYQLRHWSHLDIAVQEEMIWVRGFTPEQAADAALKSIPFHTLYYAEQGMLYAPGGLVPVGQVPELNWAPLTKALPLNWPAQNVNYFGTAGGLQVKLCGSHTEAPALVLITEAHWLAAVIDTLPDVRLNRIAWCILPAGKVLLMGEPLLPLPGAAFWRRGRFLLPMGYDLEWPFLYDTISDVIHEDKAAWIIWEKDNWWPLSPGQLQPLSRSSFRQSRQLLTNNGQ
jgi:hypothetical protein